MGGLWACRLDNPFGWKEWCESEKYFQNDFTKFFTFNIKNNAKKLLIDSSKKLDNLPNQTNNLNKLFYVLDFEILSKNYDYMEVILKDDKLYWGFAGWDIDTILIFNKDIIIQNKK